MTLELCNGIIVSEEAAMLHNTYAEFAIIDSALKVKKGASTAVPVFGTKYRSYR